MSTSSLPPEDFARLVSLQEGTLPEEQFKQLEEELRRRPELRREWIRLQDLEGELGNHFDGKQVVQMTPPKSRWIFPLALAATLTIGAIIVTLSNKDEAPSATYVAADLPGLEPVAMVTRIESSNTDDLQLGTTLKPGTIRLEQGEVELTFFSGATVSLQAPAEFQLLSETQAFLTRGKAAALVPEEAIGFTIKTPEAAVVDLGTEFAISVDQTGDSSVHVYDGEVRVSLLGQDGSTLTSSPVFGGDSLEVEVNEQQLRRVDEITELPRVSPSTPPPLTVPSNYRELVMKAAPILYWNFDAVKENQFQDQSGNGWNGQITGPVESMEGSLLFHGNSKGTSYASSASIPDINTGPYTVELWANPARLHYGTLAAICTKEVSGRHKQPHFLSVVELMTKSHLIHQPGSIRFLHRWKGSEVNAFSNNPFLPGLWHHIVGVRDHDEIRLYVNGLLNRTVRKDQESSSGTFQVVLGQLDHTRSQRAYEGMLDEFAIYPRALGEKEIRAHFQSMNLTSP